MATQYSQAASFVFRGSVEAPGDSNVGVPIEGRTAIVRVDEVLHAPAAFGDQQGQSITVVLSDPAPLSTGDRAVFFTNGWLYGETIAVVDGAVEPRGSAR
jgi:hypothetical protein